MGMKFCDRLKVAGTSAGSGVFNMGAAVLGQRTLAQAITDGDLIVGDTGIPFCIDDGQGNWEDSLFTITSTTQITRTSVLRSSAGGTTVPTYAGSSLTIFNSVPASFLTGQTVAQLSAISTVPDSYVTEWVDPATGTSYQITMANLKAQLGTGGGTAPTASSAAVANATPAVVNITMSGALNASYVPAASAFTVSGHTVSSVSISGSTVSLTVSSAFVYGEAAQTVSYSQPASNQMRDASGNLVASFASLAITNNVANTSGPTFVSAAVANATPNVINITMSSTLANIVPAASAFTVSGGKTVSSVSISGTSVNLTVSANYAYGDTITVSYTKPGSGNVLQDASGNATATFAAQSVTNNISSGTSYTVTGYSGNAVKSTLDASAATVYGSLKYLPNGNMFTLNKYWTISPTPASASSGWGTSNVTPPAVITSGANNNGASSVNGLVPGSFPGAYQDASNLWVPVGSGSTSWYFWIKMADGTNVCVNPSSPLVVTGA